MDNPQWNTALIVLGFLAVIVEVILGAVTGFDLLLVGSIFILGGVVGFLSGSFFMALYAIGALSLVYFFVLRSFLKRTLKITTTATNIDALIGKKGRVVKRIGKDKAGQVKVDGEIWRAVADEAIDEGTEVRVQSVGGVTVTVTL